MAINRGYKPAEQVIMDDWYEPSIEMLAQVGAMAQKDMNDLKGTLAKIGESQFNYLQGDYQKANEAYKNIYENIDKLSKGAMGDGDLRSVRAEIDRYSRDLSRRFSPHGDIGAMETNYKQYTEWAKKVDEMATKEYGKDGITNAHAAAIKNYVLQNYKGIGDGKGPVGYNRINLENPAVAVDLTKITEELGKGYIADSFKDAEVDPQTGQIKQGAMWKDQGRIWRKTGMGKEEVKAEDVFRDLMFGLTKHEGYRQYLDQQKLLGLSQYGMGDIYVDTVDPNTGETKKVLNENHPIVQESKRGASKFGFQKLDFSDDIKFDDWDLEEQRHRNAIKLKNLDGQMMTFQSTAVQRDLSPEEIKSAGAGLKDAKRGVTNELNMYKTMLSTGKNTDGTPLTADQKAAIQSNINGLAKRANTLDMQIKANERTQDQLAVVGGFDMAKEIAAVKASDKTLALMTDEQLATMIKSGRMAGSAAIPALGKLQHKYHAAQEKGAKIGIIQTNDVILATPDSKLGKKMVEIEDAIASGQVNFVSADGTFSFNSEKFAQMVAEGKAKVVPLATSVHGNAGFQVTIKDEKSGKFRTVPGFIEGIENTTWYNDLAVDFRDRAQAEGISTAKGQALHKQANMYDGMIVNATDMYGNDLGYGSIKSQVDQAELSIMNALDKSADIYLNNGLKMKLTAAGNNNYVPTFYRQVAGKSGSTGYVPIRRDEIGLPTQGAMSIEDIYSYIGQSNQSQRQGMVPVQTGVQQPTPTVQNNTTIINNY